MIYRLWLLVIAVLLAYRTSAQNQQKIDTLLNLLESETSKEKQVDTYVELSNIFNKSDFTKAVDYGNKALTIAGEIDYQEGLINSLHVLGMGFMAKGQFSQAKAKFTEVIDKSNAIGYLKGEASGYNGLGTALMFTGKYDSAAVLFAKVVGFQKELEDLSGLSLTYHNLGNLNFFKGNYSDALSYFVQSIDLKIRRSFQSNTRTSLGKLLLTSMYFFAN